MSSPIVHLDELQFTRDMRHGARFEAKLAPVVPVLGARGAVGGRHPGRPLADATFSGKFVPENASVEYWDGE